MRALDGNVETFEVRLVASGYIQKDGIKLFEAVYPDAIPVSIQIVLFITATPDCEIRLMRVKASSFDGNLYVHALM